MRSLARQEPQKQVSVAIFEDVQFVMDLYRERVDRLKGINLRNRTITECPDMALEIFMRSRPAIVITDLSLGPKENPDGFTIVRFIKKESPRTAVALSTSYSPKMHTPLQDRIAGEPFDAVFNKTDLEGICRFITKKAAEFRRDPIETIIGAHRWLHSTAL